MLEAQDDSLLGCVQPLLFHSKLESCGGRHTVALLAITTKKHLQ
jgi:hypothetical protein